MRDLVKNVEIFQADPHSQNMREASSQVTYTANQPTK